MKRFYEVVEVRLNSKNEFNHTLFDTQKVYDSLELAREDYDLRIKDLKARNIKNISVELNELDNEGNYISCIEFS